jgi:hypothetical protein
MKLDPEEQIIAAAFEQAELDDANERGVAARIEFRPEGHAKVTFTISREFVETARALDWTTGELLAEAIGIAIPRRVPYSLPTSPAPALVAPRCPRSPIEISGSSDQGRPPAYLPDRVEP